MIRNISLDYVKNGSFTEYHTVLHPPPNHQTLIP